MSNIPLSKIQLSRKSNLAINYIIIIYNNNNNLSINHKNTFF